MREIKVSLEEDQIRALDAQAKHSQLSRSAVIRSCLTQSALATPKAFNDAAAAVQYAMRGLLSHHQAVHITAVALNSLHHPKQ